MLSPAYGRLTSSFSRPFSAPPAVSPAALPTAPPAALPPVPESRIIACFHRTPREKPRPGRRFQRTAILKIQYAGRLSADRASGAAVSSTLSNRTHKRSGCIRRAESRRLYRKTAPPARPPLRFYRSLVLPQSKGISFRGASLRFSPLALEANRKLSAGFQLRYK